jgi:Rod binding domain-containing protein
MNLSVLQLTQEAGQNAAAAPSAVKQQSQAEAVRKAAESFEEMFISQLLQNMPSGTDPNGPFGGGQAEGVYQSMMNDQYAKTISKHGGIGLSDTLQREILKLQEVGHDTGK